MLGTIAGFSKDSVTSSGTNFTKTNTEFAQKRQHVMDAVLHQFGPAGGNDPSPIKRAKLILKDANEMRVTSDAMKEVLSLAEKQLAEHWRRKLEGGGSN